MMIDRLPEFLKKSNCELIAIDGTLYQIKVDLIEFDQVDSVFKEKIKEQLDADIKAQAALDILGCTEKDERLHQFALCRFGGFDNRPDLTSDNHYNEYLDCGKRGSCPVEGRLCKAVKAEHGYLNPRELEFIRLVAQDLPDKQIADAMNISIETAHSHRKNIERKIGCASKNGIVRFAMIKNIV